MSLFKKGNIPWSKGKTKENNSKIKSISEKLKGKSQQHSGSFKKGHKFFKGAEKGWFKKGHKINLGKVWTEKSRKKLSKAKKGKPLLKMRGEKSPYWKGGKKRGHYTNWEYNKWREKVFKKDNWTCQICKVRGNKLQADHIRRWSEYPKLRYKINNGRTLCIPCHKTTENYGNKKMMNNMIKFNFQEAEPESENLPVSEATTEETPAEETPKEETSEESETA